MNTAPRILSGPSREQGLILIVVLWVLLAISLLAVSFSASIRTEVDAARAVVDQKQSYYIARAGMEYALYRILETQSAFFQARQNQRPEMEDLPEVLRGQTSLKFGAGQADVEIIDETGKLNVNLAPDFLIFNLLIMLGIPPDQADVITDSIEDWKDPDDLIKPFGAESDYYMGLEEPYRAKNGFLDVPEELMLIQGVTPEIYYGRKGLTEAGEAVEYYGLQKYITTFSNINRINVNSAPLPVLAAIPEMTVETAQQIIQLREEMPLTNISEVSARIPGLSGEAQGFLSNLRTNIYTLISLGRIDNSKVTSRIRAVVRVDGSGRKGYAVLYWNESNTEL